MNQPPAPVRSMTGFGAAEQVGDDLTVRAELRSVNARHFKLSARVPSQIEGRVGELEATLRGEVARGTVQLNVSLSRAGTAAPGRVNEAVLADYAEQLRPVRAELGPEVTLSLDSLLRLPGVIDEAPAAPVSDAEFAAVNRTVGQALGGLLEMREREGAAVAADLLGHLAAMEQVAAQIETRLPEIVAAYRERLRERLSELLEKSGTVPDELLAREVAVLADKSDVSEELSRLRTHVDAWREALAAGGPVGRRLDFLAQELGREANTVGSKVADAEVAQLVVELKLGVERLKEQAANLE